MLPIPPLFLVLPFAVLLSMIAMGPVLYPHFWHRYYPLVSLLLAGTVIGYYIGVLGDWHSPIITLVEYMQFISLIGALYMTTGSMRIRLNCLPTPAAGIGLLCAGALLANIVGTTG